jgi:DNA replication protein DnaC
VFGSERLTGALLDRFMHHVHILEMNGDTFRLKHNRRRACTADQPTTISAPGAKA